MASRMRTVFFSGLKKGLNSKFQECYAIQHWRWPVSISAETLWHLTTKMRKTIWLNQCIIMIIHSPRNVYLKLQAI